MTDTLYTVQRTALRNAFAAMTGADPARFDDDCVAVTERPDPPLWPFAGMVVTFGVGTVASFEQRYVDWARKHVPDSRDSAAYWMLLLQQHAKQQGQDIHGMPPLIGWALADPPSMAAPPDSYRLERVDAAWMKEWQAKDVFTNALGWAAQAHRTFRNKFAYVLFDAAGEPAAVAGAFDSAGPTEIGVDVAEAHRGRGLARIVVSATARAILDAGETPYYACTPVNIRSQHTALASGFRPVCSVAIAVPGGMGLA
jgi:hypothetical protein